MSSEEVIEYDESIGGLDEPVPDWHMRIIEERLALYEKEGIQGTPLEEFEKELFDLLSSQESLKD